MNWVLIEDIHVNLNQVEFFGWRDGTLTVFFERTGKAFWDDPDKAKYTKLCHLLGVRPYEEVK